MRGSRLPRQATQTTRPLGSGTIAASACSVRAANSPPAPVDSSSVTVLTIRSPASVTPSSASVHAASTMHATPPFMSHAPRPYSRPSRSTAVNGSGCVQSARGSTSTTSTWPLSSSVLPPPLPRKRATSCGRPVNVEPVGHHRVRPQRLGIGLVQLDLGAVPAQERREVLLQRALLARRRTGRVRDRVVADELAREHHEGVAAVGDGVGDGLFLWRELHDAIP